MSEYKAGKQLFAFKGKQYYVPFKAVSVVKPAQAHEKSNELAKALPFMAIEAFYAGIYDTEEWQADLWRVTVKNRDNSYTMEYKTGLGHRVYGKSAARKAVEASQNVFVRKPNLADILYCLQLDSMAEDSFCEWCAEYGYDEDSRKALDIYLQCQKQTEEYKKLFTSEERAIISELLQDY